MPCDYHALVGYGHDPTFSCKCCAENCTKTATLDCSGDAFQKVRDGCELRLASNNRTLDQEALEVLADKIKGLSLL